MSLQMWPLRRLWCKRVKIPPIRHELYTLETDVCTLLIRKFFSFLSVSTVHCTLCTRPLIALRPIGMWLLTPWTNPMSLCCQMPRLSSHNNGTLSARFSPRGTLPAILISVHTSKSPLILNNKLLTVRASYRKYTQHIFGSTSHFTTSNMTMYY